MKSQESQGTCSGRSREAKENCPHGWYSEYSLLPKQHHKAGKLGNGPGQRALESAAHNLALASPHMSVLSWHLILTMTSAYVIAMLSLLLIPQFGAFQ